MPHELLTVLPTGSLVPQGTGLSEKVAFGTGCNIRLPGPVCQAKSVANVFFTQAAGVTIRNTEMARALYHGGGHESLSLEWVDALDDASHAVREEPALARQFDRELGRPARPRAGVEAEADRVARVREDLRGLFLRAASLGRRLDPRSGACYIDPIPRGGSASALAD